MKQNTIEEQFFAFNSFLNQNQKSTYLFGTILTLFLASFKTLNNPKTVIFFMRFQFKDQQYGFSYSFKSPYGLGYKRRLACQTLLYLTLFCLQDTGEKSQSESSKLMSSWLFNKLDLNGSYKRWNLNNFNFGFYYYSDHR
jgi:hypothetical protein